MQCCYYALRMRYTNALLSLALLAAPAYAKKRAPEPPPIYINAMPFAASCDTVWPIVVQAFNAKGFAPKTSDRAGGILTFSWQRGDDIGPRLANPSVRVLTLAPSGVWNSYDKFRIESATATVFAEKTGCRIQINVAYQGQRGGWFVLPSNNKLEQLLLEEIRQALSLASTK